MSREQIGVVRRIESLRERALASNPHLSPYARAAILGHRVVLPEAKCSWVTVDCRTGVKTILDGPPAPAIAIKAPLPRPSRIVPVEPTRPANITAALAYWSAKREREYGKLPKWEIKAIKSAVCRVSGISKYEMVYEGHERRAAYPRHVAMLIAIQSNPQISLPAIGKQFGGRDHTTLMAAAARVLHRKLDQSSDTARWYREAVALLSGEGE